MSFTSGFFGPFFGTPSVATGNSEATPNAFTLTFTGGPFQPGLPATSNAITVAGITAAAAVSVTAPGSTVTASVNGGAYGAVPSTLANGDTIALRAVASIAEGGSVTVTLTIGGVSSVATVTTRASAVFAINGDSRTQQAVDTVRTFQTTAQTSPLNNALQTNANGWVVHMLNALDHRVVLPPGSQFAIGAETTADMAARAAQDALQAEGFGCKNMIFLGGINDGNLTLAQSIANWTTIFDAFTARGMRLIVMNELPANSAESDPTIRLQRVAWLSDPARATTWPGMIQVDTFNPCLKVGTNYSWKDGYSYDGLHPSYTGSKVIGEAVATAIAPYFPLAATPSLIVLPTTATTADFVNSVSCMMTGTTGTLSSTPAPTGVVATGWTVAPSSGTQTGLNIQCSKGTSPAGFDEQIIRIFGSSSLTTARGFSLQSANLSAVSSMAPGTVLRAYARLRIDAGATGAFGVGVGAFVQGTNLDTPSSGFALRRVQAFRGSSVSGFELDGTAVDYELMSQDLVVPANWANATGKQTILTVIGSVQFNSVAVDMTVRISQFGLRVISTP